MTSKGFDQVIRTPGYVAQLELGLRKNPSLDVVRRLARALGVRLSELLG
jgi:transcriptional regulator with XRE-family HTH domain